MSKQIMRVRSSADAAPLTMSEAHDLMRTAASGKADWGQIKPRVVAAFETSGGFRTREQAEAAFEAFRRKPYLLPSPPPKGAA